jgi:hypothetical protein
MEHIVSANGGPVRDGSTGLKVSRAVSPNRREPI